MLDQSKILALLAQLSYYEGPLTLIAVGQDTFQRAIRRFQADAGLIADGIYGPKTDAVLTRVADRLLNGNIARRYARFRLTRYFIESEADYAGARTVPLLDDAGRVLELVTPQFFVHLSLEGTGRLIDGRLVNVSGKRISVPAADYASVAAVARQILPAHPEWGGVTFGVTGDVTHACAFENVVNAGVGYGMANGRPLVPFRSLASDTGYFPGCEPRFLGKGGLVPTGTRVFIPEAAGKAFPDGKPHDGWFHVHDTGSAIVGAHFDVFVGSRVWARAAWNLPAICHAWFQLVDSDGKILDTVETRVPFGYTKGLAD